MEYLSDNFRPFFKNLNIGNGTEQIASREYDSIKTLLEDPRGLARELSPRCFLQGSYKQETAIHDLNDVDIVVLCELWYPGAGGTGSRSWSRNEIFAAIAAPLLADGRYKDKVRYGAGSMCIKVDLGIKVEILPVVYKAGNHDPLVEPFALYRPGTAKWEDGYARYHQQWLSWKNGADKTGGNFIPVIKVLKHIRTIFGKNAVSFHVESLLFRLPDSSFLGAPVEYIPRVLNAIASVTPEGWYATSIKTPCGDRDIFTGPEWALADWQDFHQLIVTLASLAGYARDAATQADAVKLWKIVLGDAYFPA